MHDMLFVDTHTHLYMPEFGEDGDDAVRRAAAAGVTRLVFPDVNSETRSAMEAMAARFPGTVFQCAGLHPTELTEDWKSELDKLYEAGRKNGIVAIGETGMDCHWSRETVKEQETVFRAQIELALTRDLPLIVHSRDATELTLKILSDYKGRGIRGVFHAYGGSYETFLEICRLGDWYVGIGGVITFKNASISETIKKIPLDRILTETDSPWLSPVPFRGKRNESSYIPYIAEKIALQKGITVEEAADITTQNAKSLFRI